MDGQRRRKPPATSIAVGASPCQSRNTIPIFLRAYHMQYIQEGILQGFARKIYNDIQCSKVCIT